MGAWNDNRGLSMYQSAVSSNGSDSSLTDKQQSQARRQTQTQRKSIFDRESVKMVPKVERTKSEVGIKIGVTEQNNVVAKHANFVKLVYALLFSSVLVTLSGGVYEIYNNYNKENWLVNCIPGFISIIATFSPLIVRLIEGRIKRRNAKQRQEVERQKRVSQTIDLDKAEITSLLSN